MEQCKANTYRLNDCVEVVVYRPVLDDAERQKREAALKRALACFGKGKYQRKEANNIVHKDR